jgi:hypothetical protein
MDDLLWNRTYHIHSITATFLYGNIIRTSIGRNERTCKCEWFVSRIRNICKSNDLLFFIFHYSVDIISIADPNKVIRLYRCILNIIEAVICPELIKRQKHECLGIFGYYLIMDLNDILGKYVQAISVDECHLSIDFPNAGAETVINNDQQSRIMSNNFKKRKT